MFGFQRLGRKSYEDSVPAAASTVMVLISKEDIYRENRGLAPILLLRKNQEVDPDDLPKLIQHGARPEQFRFQYKEGAFNALPGTQADHDDDETEISAEFERHAEATTTSNPILSPPSSATGPSELQRKKVMILEPDQKSMKRLIDCLFVCGFDLNRIQPVRIPSQLAWSMERHRPHILVVDYHLQGQQDGLSLLNSLQCTPGVEQIILTVSPRPTLSLAEEVALRKLCAEKEIKILYKPASRFALKQLLLARPTDPFALSPRRAAL